MVKSDYAMTTKEVADYLNISNQMVYNLITDGELPAFKVGSASRIMFSDLEKYIFQKKDEFITGKSDVFRFSVNNLSLKIDDFEIPDMSFSFPKGKILSILGSSGSGKTLLLKAIAGLLPIHSGEIHMGRTRIDILEPAKRQIGYVFENYALFPHLSGRKNIEFPLKIGKKPKYVINDETEKCIKELDIDFSYLESVPEQLPEGIKQLIAIARGKNHNFNLFLMDEPMTHLDASHHIMMRMFLQKLVRDLHQTTIIAFNDPADALALSDYIAVLGNGKILQFGESWEIYHNPASLEVLQLISVNGVNFFEIEIKEGQILTYNIPSDRKDGKYIFAFRIDDVKISDKGFEVIIDNAQFYDSNRQLSICHLKQNAEVKFTLLLPVDSPKEIRILPGEMYFFNI
ncbi:MAG: ATP-binding cassette domain-containing protein [Spirochaetes bacterium]|nr:ATP-binding cassette domain-containing protein [Spirochaetota bacterium]